MFKYIPWFVLSLVLYINPSFAAMTCGDGSLTTNIQICKPTVNLTPAEFNATLDYLDDQIGQTDYKKIIDFTGSEAFLIRKTSDAGDVFNVNTTNSKASVGIAAGDGTFHIHTGTGAGSVTADSGADDLVIENNTEVGITLLSPHDQPSSIFFGSIDGDDDPVTDTARDARIHWLFSESTLTVGTNTGGGLLKFKTDGGTVQLILAANGLATFSQDVSIGDLAAVGSDPLCWDGSGASLIGDCSSLREWKNNIVDTDMGLAEVLQLRAREFDWDEQHGHGRHDFGFVAEEVEAVNPLLVTYRPELTGVKYSKLTALLVKAIQELEARVAVLEE